MRTERNISRMAAVCAAAMLLVEGAQTRATEQFEPIKTVELGERRELQVNGKPFFPIMSWAQSTSRLARLRSLGFNTFNSSGKSGKEALEKSAEAGGYAMVHHNYFAPDLKSHPSLLAWSLRDEPDLGLDKGKPRVALDELAGWYRKAREQDPTRPVFLNFCAYFIKSPDFSGEKAEVRAYYQAAARAADILCFDIYPIYQRNRDDKLTWVADGITDLLSHAGPGQPAWAWIESCKGSKWITFERQKDVTPEMTRAEVWMAIIRGATGIGYFTHAWRPSFTEFAPTEEMQQELKRTNEQITRFTPIILAPPAAVKTAITFEGGLKGEIMVREHAGKLFLFANNLDMQDLGGRKDDVKTTYRAGTATITVPGLKAGTMVEVVDENRSLIAVEGKFRDRFEKLEVHIYRLQK